MWYSLNKTTFGWRWRIRANDGRVLEGYALTRAGAKRAAARAVQDIHREVAGAEASQPPRADAREAEFRSGDRAA